MQFDFMALLVSGTLAAVAIATFLSTFFTVEQNSIAVLQRFGRFERTAGPGIRAKIPFIDKVAGRINLRVRQLDVEVETKTADYAFVRLAIVVQYGILPEKVYEAFYKLDDATAQITSFALDIVRSQVPKISLDDLFAKKSELAGTVKAELARAMEEYGFGILDVLLTGIEPDVKVKRAMNKINAAQRLRTGATAGLRDSVEEFRKAVPGATAKDVMHLVLMTQYFDMLKEVGASSRTNAILIPHSPEALTAVTKQMCDAVFEADRTGKSSEAAHTPLPGLVMASEDARTPYGHKHAEKHPPGNGG
jgi:hypothetical protein